MAFNTNAGKQQFAATAGQTVFDFNFAIFNDTDLRVYLTPNGQTADDTADLLTLSTNYTVTIDGTIGGTVTLLSGASIGDTVTLLRSLPINRETDYVTNGDLYADTLDADQDYQTYLVVDGYTQLNRALKVPESLANVSLDLPSPSSDTYIKWNATADALENDTSIPDNLTLSQTAATTATTQAGIATTKAGEASDSAALAAGYAASINPSTLIQTQTHAATSKTTPVDADELPLVDSAASNVLKKLTWANLKATLKTYFDTLYIALTGDQTVAGKKSFTGNLLQTGASQFGYGTGSGGTVTQSTSKSTAVTLNKPTGQITMNNASLAAGATVGFALNNTYISTSDTVIVTILDTSTTSTSNYQSWATVRSNVCSINLKNNTAGSLSEAVIINFTIIKGATA